ncbi:MAG: type II toxin-antitoxin system VapC family toxin [Thermoflexales bacterium]|nr:type II toxin-antitoxin system VapC family toxin [Thermoflexales bacterium]
MADYYADSSALVKRHVHEAGTDWFRTVCIPAAGNVIITTRISMVEVYSALNRRQREANISLLDYAELVSDFDAICTGEYQLVELTPLVIKRAKSLLERHSLRASDAVHLASALLVQDTLRSAGLPSLTFLAADDQLLAAARTEGLATDNPNEHP